MPSRRCWFRATIAYNKAAGAETRERTLRSYVLGHYKSERNEVSGTAKPVPCATQQLFGDLACFHNEGYDQTVTLAQVFWMKRREGQPARLFVGANSAVDRRDFANFGSDIARLRKKLRALRAELHDSFPPYAAGSVAASASRTIRRWICFIKRYR